MSHTNTTTNYNLPQFITTDKPAWLTDVNNAFLSIDSGMHNAQTKADSAQNDATQALTNAGSAATAAATADGKGSGAVASIADTFNPAAIYAVGDIVMYNSLLYICEVAVITPGPWTGASNWARATVEDLIDSAKNLIDAATKYTAGDTIPLRYKCIPGIVTNNSNTLQFFVQANKVIDTAEVTSCNITGSTFRIYSADTSEQISLTDGNWTFNVRTDGILCTFTLDNTLNSQAAVNLYFSSTTTLTLVA